VATAEIAAKLQTRRGAALLIITQTDYDASGEPIVYSIEYHVPDKFVFVIHRKGPD
jgi:DNA-binding GntR family transcriptional regulator